MQKEIKIDLKEKRSRAKKIRNLIKKQKGILKEEIKTTKFKEPIMLLERLNGEVELYEDVTKGLFEYKHSNGETRFIIVEPSTKRSFGFADRRFTGYIAHENYPITGLPEPLMTVEQVNTIVEKSINDMKEWKAKEIREYKGLVKWAFIGLAIVIVAYFLGKAIVGSPPEAQTIIQVVNQTPTIIP